jgi:hypothetical protein
VFEEGIGKKSIGKYEVDLGIAMNWKIQVLANISESIEGKYFSEPVDPRIGCMFCCWSVLDLRLWIQTEPFTHLKMATTDSCGGMVVSLRGAVISSCEDRISRT